MTTKVLWTTALTAAACTTAACTSGVSVSSGTSAGSTSGPSAPPTQKTLGATSGTQPHPAAAWPQFNRDAARSGVAAHLRPAGPLSIRWRAHLDGALLNATNLGGIGGQRMQAAVCTAFGAAAVSGSTVYEPCTSNGLAAINVSAARMIRVLWRGPGGANRSPAVGGGAVWVTDVNSGTLYELSQATGSVRQQISIGAGLPHFSSLSLGNGTAFVATLNGITAVGGA